MLGALSDETASLSCTTPAGLASAVILGFEFSGTHDHILLSQSRDSPTWSTRSQYLYPAVTGRPSYTPRHCVPSSLPSTTRRAMVEVYEPASTRASINNLTTSPRYITQTRTAKKTSLLLLRVLSLTGKQRVHRAVTLQWIYMSQYINRCSLNPLLIHKTLPDSLLLIKGTIKSP
jgi:hypothetical protein